MIRNKKLISLLCALAMVVTMLSGLTITASAAGEGYTLSTPTYQKDGTITVDVGYENMATVAYGYFQIEMPAEVTNVTADPAEASAYDVETHTFSFQWTYGTNPVTPTDGKGTITTLTITTDTLFSDKNITFKDTSYIGDADFNDYEVGENATASTVALPRNPDAPPKTDATPGPVATPDPNGKQPLDPDVASTVGYVFGEPTANDDNTEITVDVNYVGMPTVGYGYFQIEMPEGVTDVTAEPAEASAYDAATHTFSFQWTYGTKPVSSADGKGKITTLTIKLDKPFTEAKQIAFKDTSYIGDADFNDYEVGKENVLASNVKLPYAVPESFDIPFSDVLTGGEVTDTPGAGATDSDSEYFIIPKVTVTDAEGNEVAAVYDEDYVVVLETDDGNEIVLTKDQYENFMNGYLGADNIKALCEQAGIKDINDVIGKLKVRAYNSSAKVSAQLVKKSTGEIADEGEAGTTPEQNKSTSGSISPLKTTKNVYVGDSISLKFTVKPAKDKNGDVIAHGTKDGVAINVDAASFNVLSATGITIETKDADGKVHKDRATINDADNYMNVAYSTDNTYTVKFTPLAKTAKDEPIAFTVKYTDANGDETTATATYTVKEKSTTSGSSSSSGSGSDKDSTGTGIIANGDVGGYTDGTGYTSPFVDMAGYDWAQQAVAALAAKNLISGKGNGIFDPGGQITRAEYAQMVVNAIGRSGDYADTSFLDVPTDAWFYHNVAVAAQLGIVSGYGNGYFGPNDLITREQMALMTQKAAIVVGKSLSGAAVQSFTDDADISDWAKPAVYDLANVGIINGTGNGAFTPKANATRAEAAVIIYNAFVK